MQKRPVKPAVIWLLVGIGLLYLFQINNIARKGISHPSYTQFYEAVKAGSVQKVEMMADVIHGEYKDGQRFVLNIPQQDPDLISVLRKNVRDFQVHPENNVLTNLIFSLAPMLLFIGFLWFFVYRQVKGVGTGALSFGKSRARLLTKERDKVTFKDVAGVDEAKDELQEIIEFLKDPKKFQRLGGRIPKGVLLIGPPGSGKTLLAKSVAGEADVPFFTISGSDFVEMFVGVGASRVRDLFEQGKRHAPCIIFIDEIDAVGRHRGAGIGGGHDEREQTLNALLVEMDGFNTQEGVIIMAATNRPDVLDPALLRPGRFDRQVVVDLPDLQGRLGILKVHTQKVILTKDVDLSMIARGTPGFSGADLANLVNEAALLAARSGKKSIDLGELEEARDKVRWGRERKSRIISAEDRRITAYHESGHALVLQLLPETEPLHKVTIIPRGLAYLGATMQLPQTDRYTQAKKELLGQITGMMGGRVAEELTFGEVTSGACSDLKNATQMARKMVCEWGMSEKLGPMTFGEREEHIFLGREISRSVDYSEATALNIDQEVRKIIDECYQRAKKLVEENRDKLIGIAETLLKREVMEGKEIEAIVSGKVVPQVDPTINPYDKILRKRSDPIQEKTQENGTAVI
ncbi:MAG: ATP-dependent metallopeptidase FtsH/Yme1/Tma family protein [Chlamydiae bacterium]|nr:ATP-dependent metallopeptidase FtsH/Yme1/Tma family protein [Chlamydiota bacterium]MBI3278023.1 ATP-dependent metallopeptidase FtsH/Yme1/Tma family protein [Chlamydiota bacterium]